MEAENDGPMGETMTNEAKHNPDAGPLSQAIELLERIYSYTRHDQPVHWSVCIDVRFFLERYSSKRCWGAQE
jgi:hypothetical protein